MSPRLRAACYAIANSAVFLIAVVGSISVGVPMGRAVYVITLFALCSAPILLMDSLNGRYALLGIFMAIYFVFFGALDLLSMIFPTPAQIGAAVVVSPDFMSAGECGILLGALLAIVGYVAAARTSRATVAQATKDWPTRSIVVLGLVLWLIGSAAIIYFQIFVLNEKTSIAATRGITNLGPVKTFFVLLANLVQPLGVLLLAYGYARFRTLTWLALILVVVFAQVAIGFVTDIKSIAMLAGILVILTRTLVDNRLPKAWIVCGMLFLAAAFPVFQAYRQEVTGQRGMTRAEALQQLGKVIEITLAARNKVTSVENAGRSQTFFERASLKANVEMAFEHTGVDTPYEKGLTLLEVPLAFIPRIVWPDKPSEPTGRLFNKAFIRGGDPDTYISPSHLGELYWNFGWSGVLLGMPLIGLLLGVIGKKTSLAERLSVTRLLVLLVTIKGVCLGFEGAISTAYVVWLRSLAAVGILHLLFARRIPMASQNLSAPGQDPTLAPLLPAPQLQAPKLPQTTRKSDPEDSVSRLPLVPRFPNLLR